MKATKKLNKNNYEVVIIVHPDTSLEQQKELFRKNKSIIEAANGEVHSVETWGKRSLANHIDGIKKAIYFHSFFTAETNAIAELERTMRISDHVLRFMHTSLDSHISLAKHQETFKKGLAETMAKEKERDAKMQAKRAAMADRPDRGDRGDRGERGERSERFERR